MSKVFWETSDGRKIDIDELDAYQARSILKLVLQGTGRKNNIARSRFKSSRIDLTIDEDLFTL